MSKNILAGSRPVLPPVLTSYDFLKATALILMIIDHVGYFFYPDDLGWRAVGRLSAPIWLFLVGYARSRDIGPRMWIGMIVLVASNYVFGLPVLPVNILGTIIVCRLLIDPVMGVIRRNPQILYPFMGLLFVGAFFTFVMVEYGTTALMMVMAGYLVRHREDMGYSRSQVVQFAGVAGLVYAFIQVFIYFGFDSAARLAVTAGILLVMLFLTGFRLYEYPVLTARLGPVAGLLRICGRRTLEIYVLHLLAFKAAAWWLQTQPLTLFDFHIV